MLFFSEKDNCTGGQFYFWAFRSHILGFMLVDMVHLYTLLHLLRNQVPLST
jgi:hypothetical protein